MLGRDCALLIHKSLRTFIFCRDGEAHCSVRWAKIQGNTLKRLATVLEINYKQSHIYLLHK